MSAMDDVLAAFESMDAMARKVKPGMRFSTTLAAAREELAMLRGYLTRRRATLKEEGHDPIAADGCDACKEMADIDTALGESAPTRAGEGAA